MNSGKYLAAANDMKSIHEFDFKSTTIRPINFQKPLNFSCGKFKSKCLISKIDQEFLALSFNEPNYITICSINNEEFYNAQNFLMNDDFPPWRTLWIPTTNILFIWAFQPYKTAAYIRLIPFPMKSDIEAILLPINAKIYVWSCCPLKCEEDNRSKIAVFDQVTASIQFMKFKEEHK